DPRLAGLAQKPRRLLQVAAGLTQRVPAVHHSGPGGVPEGLDLSGRYLHVGWCSLLRCQCSSRLLVARPGPRAVAQTRGDRVSLVGAAAPPAASAGAAPPRPP